MSPADRSHIALQATFHALLDLLRTRPEDRITISDLCAKAGVSRTYYYRNFTTFNDVIEEAMLDDSLHYLCSLPSLPTLDFSALMARYFQLIQHRREDYTLLAAVGKDAAMITTFINVYQYLLAHDRIKIHPNSNTTKRYWPRFMAGAVITTALAWIQDDSELTPEQLGATVAGFLKIK